MNALGLGGVILALDEPFDTGGLSTSDVDTELGITNANEQLIRDIIETIELEKEFDEEEEEGSIIGD